MKRLILSLCLLIAVMLAAYHGVRMVKPAGLTNADMHDAGYLNVKQDLGVIAAHPHPAASPRQAEVRRYLQETISAMGYRVVEQPFTFTITDMVSQQERLYANLNEPQRKAFDAELARVGAAGSFEKEVRIRSGLQDGERGQGTNLIVTHTVPGATGTVLLMAHYDSVGTAPGASDDGMAVACLLPLMRETTSHSDVKNNVIFLLPDGEELGLLGAKHFVSQLSPAERNAIGLVVNFEARGNRGVPLLFETSPKNNRLINVLNNGVKDIIAFSFTPLIYQMLQNDTDMTAFKPYNVTGLNFAVVEGFEHYHHMSDTVENLPPETLFRYQKMVRDVGQYSIHDVDVSTLSANEDAVYFPLPFGKLLVMPLMAAYLVGIGLFLLCGIWAWQCRNSAKSNDNSLARIKSLAILLLGMICATLSFLAPTVVYLLTLPLLFCVLLILLKQHFYLAFLTALSGVYVTGILYFPVIYLVTSGLQLPLVAGVIGFIPLVLWSLAITEVVSILRQSRRL